MPRPHTKNYFLTVSIADVARELNLTRKEAKEFLENLDAEPLPLHNIFPDTHCALGEVSLYKLIINALKSAYDSYSEKCPHCRDSFSVDHHGNCVVCGQLWVGCPN